MKTRNVISNKNYRTKSPLLAILVTYLCFDKWDAPQWLYGVFGVLLFIIFISWVIDLFITKEVNIFDKDEKEKHI